MGVYMRVWGQHTGISFCHEEYIKLLSGNPVLLSLDTVIQNEIDQTKKEIGLDIPEEKLEEWKKEYRRIDKHRRI